jgi:Flp pilus assembly protein TadG
MPPEKISNVAAPGRSRRWRGLHFGKSEAGTALIELALVGSLVLLPIFLGLCEMGWVFYDYVEVKNAAAAGVEYGARTAANYTDITGITNAANYEAKDVTMSTGYPQVDYRVCTDASGVPTNCVTCTSAASCTWPSAPNSIFVDVHTETVVSELITNKSITLTGYATMRAQ